MNQLPTSLLNNFNRIIDAIKGIEWFKWCFFLFIALVILKSNFFVTRSPNDFNFGGEWDFMLTAKEYARHGISHNKLLSYWATYDDVANTISLNRYTHYPFTAYAPYVIALKFFKTGYSSQLMWVNLIYFFIFTTFIFYTIKDELSEGNKILFALCFCILFYSGYWKAILVSFGIYTVSVMLAPIFIYSIVKNRFWLITLTFLALCLSMYEAYFCCILFYSVTAWQKKNLKIFFIGLSIPIISFAFRILSNYWYYQNWKMVMVDLVGAYGQRSAECSILQQQTAENLKNYGAVSTCSFETFITHHLDKLKSVINEIPARMLDSYGIGTAFFIYALLSIFYKLSSNFNNLQKLDPIYVFLLTYLIGALIFVIMLPAMALQGWMFFFLMPLTIGGLYLAFKKLSPLSLQQKIFSIPLFNLLCVVPLLIIFLNRTGFPATLNDKEINLMTSVQIACENNNGFIRTNLDFNYFSYICKDLNFQIKYVAPSPNESQYISFAKDPNSLELKPVLLDLSR